MIGGSEKTLSSPCDGPGGVDEGLGEAVVVPGAQGQAAADRFETIDAQLLDQDVGLLGVGLLGVGLDHELDELGDVEIPDNLGLGGIGLRLGLRDTPRSRPASCRDPRDGRPGP